MVTAVASTRVLQFGLFELMPCGLSITGDPSYDDWIDCGTTLRRIEGAMQFAIGDWLNYGERRWGEKYDQAITATGFDYGTLATYAWVAKQVEFSRRRENLPHSIHRELAPLEPDQQDVWLTRVADEHLTVAQLRVALRRSKRLASFDAGPLPDGPFRVVYADPPWAYDDSGVITTKGGYGRAERHYPTMSIEDLCALDVRSRVADDAVLFLWVTSPLLGECWPVIEAWGFDYKTSIVWDKRAHNYGHYVSVRHELLLICTRGSCTPDEPTPMPESVMAIRRSSEHSEKPQEFRALIERLYPLGSRLELFAREAVPGWVAYGNQLCA